jgi:hypothetical protein
VGWGALFMYAHLVSMVARNHVLILTYIRFSIPINNKLLFIRGEKRVAFHELLGPLGIFLFYK